MSGCTPNKVSGRTEQHRRAVNFGKDLEKTQIASCWRNKGGRSSTKTSREVRDTRFPLTAIIRKGSGEGKAEDALIQDLGKSVNLKL